MPEEKKLNIPWFKRGDVDAVIGVFFDGFSKIIVGIGVLTGVMGMSQDIVFGKIVSAIGLSALFQGKCAAGASDALGATGKGTANYFIVVGIVETVALFTLVFGLLLLG